MSRARRLLEQAATHRVMGRKKSRPDARTELFRGSKEACDQWVKANAGKYLDMRVESL